MLVFLAVVVPLAAVAHLWGAQVERTGSSIVVRNGLFSHRHVISTRDLEVDGARLDFVGLFKLTGVGQDLPRAIVLVDQATGRRTKIVASAVATRNQRQQLWEQLTRRLAKAPGAYSRYQIT